MGRRLPGIISALALGVAGLVVVGPQSAQSVQTEHHVVVSDDPVNFTPHVLDGEVYAIAEVGDVVVVGGVFTQAQNDAGGPILARTNILAYDKNTGEILTDFNPVLNNEVRALVPAPDGTSVYVGGKFNQVNGTPTYKITQLDVHTGQTRPRRPPGGPLRVGSRFG